MTRGRIIRFAVKATLAGVLTGLTLVCLRAEARAADRRVALVIGNSTYRNAPGLTNPAKDAQAFAEMLKSAGFDSVELQRDLDSLDLKRAIRAFVLSARDSDVAVVFFAGHGIEVNGTNYLIPVDAKLKTDYDAEDEGVGLDRIIRAVEPARRLRLIILDACRDNPFTNRMQRTVSSRAIAAGLGKVEPESSDTLVAYAARAGSFAEDGRADHSPFTTALLKHLPTPGLDIRVAFGRVRDDVMRATGGKQEPFVYGSLGGSTISIMRETAVPPSSPSPAKDPNADIRHDYEFAERVATKDGWTYFLQAHPTGFFADLARAQLAKFAGKPAQFAKSEGTKSEGAKFEGAKSDVTKADSAESVRIDLSKPETRSPTLTPPVAVALAPQPAAPSPVAVQPPVQLPRKEPAAPAPVVDRNPCERDRETLARLRDAQVVADILRFSRELKCEALRAQLIRLLESTGSTADLSKFEPPLAPSPAKPTESTAGPTTRLAPVPEAITVQPDRSPASCETESQTLARLRTAPDLGALDRFAQDMTCSNLKPQVLRLRESLQD